MLTFNAEVAELKNAEEYEGSSFFSASPLRTLRSVL
jgi:hypothetical protein